MKDEEAMLCITYKHYPVSLGNLQLKAAASHSTMYHGNKRKERLMKMTLEERHKEYLRDYVPLKDSPTWMEEMKSKI